MSKIKLEYQTVLTLRYFEELSIMEIADILKLPENTVKTHVHRGIEALKKRL